MQKPLTSGNAPTGYIPMTYMKESTKLMYLYTALNSACVFKINNPGVTAILIIGMTGIAVYLGVSALVGLRLATKVR